MIKISLREATKQFSQYMKLVRQGQMIILTDSGTPIAMINRLPGKLIGEAGLDR